MPGPDEYVPGWDRIADEMRVACWCMQGEVWLPRHLVGTTTRSCGRSGCEPAHDGKAVS